MSYRETSDDRDLFDLDGLGGDHPLEAAMILLIIVIALIALG